MQLRTHLVLAALFVLLFLPNISNKFLFIAVALVSTILPDIDTGFSLIGRQVGTGVVRFFTKHRGMLHSFTFCILISVILAFFLPVLSLAFFLGYSIHLFGDSFTVEGIRPFWPSKKVSEGHLRAGGRVETMIFIFLALADLIVLVMIINNIA